LRLKEPSFHFASQKGCTPVALSEDPSYEEVKRVLEEELRATFAKLQRRLGGSPIFDRLMQEFKDCRTLKDYQTKLDKLDKLGS